MLNELYQELFPPRHLFLITGDFSGIELKHALALMDDLTAEKEAEILREFLEKQGKSDDEDEDSDDMGISKNLLQGSGGKLVMYERKGIKTDLFAIEKYIDNLY
jgi:hypothetical protein